MKLKRIVEDTLYLSGVDLVDGTPVLDIKPYLSRSDSFPEAHAGWLDDTQDWNLEVEFSQEALFDLENFEPRLKKMIVQVLENDPRNFMDKDNSRQNKLLGFYLADANVLFRVESQKATVVRVEPR